MIAVLQYTIIKGFEDSRDQGLLIKSIPSLEPLAPGPLESL
jgi:hypothetical protein